jgi:hypothetical protein
MGSLPWSTFKAKLNERFTPHNQILKDGQELLNLLQSNSPKTMGRYVQTFVLLLSPIPMKEEYTQKWPSYMAYSLGLIMPSCKKVRSLQPVKR